MAKLKLKANVGRRPHRHCMNLVADQIAVITLLNAIPVQVGGAGGRLSQETVRAGSCSDELFEAIKTFQRKSTAMEDGIIEPGGPALIFMNNLADAHLPMNLVGVGGNTILQNTASDIRIESWKQVPDKYQPKVKEDKKAIDAWDKLKIRLRADLPRSMFVKGVLRFLNEQEGMYGKTTGIGAWARIFAGKVFIERNAQQGFEEHFLLEGEVLSFNGARKIVKVNNMGIPFDPPVILFNDLTYYIMNKNEVVEVAYEHFVVKQ